MSCYVQLYKKQDKNLVLLLVQESTYLPFPVHLTTSSYSSCNDRRREYMEGRIYNMESSPRDKNCKDFDFYPG